MPEVPDVSIFDPGVAQNSLLIAFSFSLRPDGSPGRCNQKIAIQMKDVISNTSLEGEPAIGMQWEIYEAMEENLRESIPLDFVAPPPLFTDEDVLGDLNLSGAPAFQRLIDLAPELASLQHEDVVKRLNQILEHRTFYEHFEAMLDLHDLVRADKGLIGLEKRRMPRRTDYGEHGLGLFQARRVNRLILETLFPETEIRRARYLNTEGVARHVMDQLKSTGRQVRYVFVFAHPEHRDWCQKNLTKVLSESQPSVEVLNGDVSRWDANDLWDRDSAQVWCRSPENFEHYASL